MIIFIGVSLSCYSSWLILDTKIQTLKTTKEAKEIVTDGSEIPNSNRYSPNIGEVSGLLIIPTLSVELPVVEGTNPDELEKGVGHYRGSYYPGENGQIVLSGHRDSVFRNLGELKVGDLLILEIPSGKYTYEIVKTRIVESDDRTIITLQDQKEELILTTCYPFQFIGNAPQRYIIFAKKAY